MLLLQYVPISLFCVYKFTAHLSSRFFSGIFFFFCSNILYVGCHRLYHMLNRITTRFSCTTYTNWAFVVDWIQWSGLPSVRSLHFRQQHNNSKQKPTHIHTQSVHRQLIYEYMREILYHNSTHSHTIRCMCAMCYCGLLIPPLLFLLCLLSVRYIRVRTYTAYIRWKYSIGSRAVRSLCYWNATATATYKTISRINTHSIQSVDIITHYTHSQSGAHIINTLAPLTPLLGASNITHIYTRISIYMSGTRARGQRKCMQFVCLRQHWADQVHHALVLNMPTVCVRSRQVKCVAWSLFLSPATSAD